MTRLSHLVGSASELYQSACAAPDVWPADVTWRPSPHCMEMLQALDKAMYEYSALRKAVQP